MSKKYIEILMCGALIAVIWLVGTTISGATNRQRGVIPLDIEVKRKECIAQGGELVYRDYSWGKEEPDYWIVCEAKRVKFWEEKLN